MLRRFWARLCPHCITDERPIEEHPAIRAMDATGGRLDRLLNLFDQSSGDGESGHAARDMLSGSYTGDREGRR